MSVRTKVRFSTLRTAKAFFAGALLTAAACGSDTGSGDRADLEAKVPPSVIADVTAGTGRDVLVELSDDVVFDPSDVAAGGAEAAELRALQTATYEDDKASILDGIADGIEVRAELAHLPVMSLHISSLEALEALAAHPGVVRVSEDVAYALAPAASAVHGTELVAVMAAAQRPEGTVALLDSGIDAAACGDCRVVASAQLAVDDGADDGHGSVVAGKLAALLPGARFAALDVVSSDGMVRTSAVLAGIDWSIEHLDTSNIVALQLGLADDSALAEGVLGKSLRVAGTAGISAVASAQTMARIREPGFDTSYAQGSYTKNVFAMPTATSVSIAGGAVYANSTLVILTLAATGATEMCVSNTTTCTSWVPYTTSKAWSLAAGNGTKTVRVWFGDGAGARTAAPSTDTIILDATKPAVGSVSVVPDAASPDDTHQVSWSGFSDIDTGIASYKVLRHTTVPVSCTDLAATVVTASTTALTLSDATALTTGTTYHYRVCATDAAGNQASATGSGTPATQRVAPMAGSVQIVKVATTTEIPYTNTTSVKLVLAATPQGAATMTKMCISTTPTCTFGASSPAYATAVATYALPAGTGLKTVYVWFKDSDGNVTPAPYVDTVVLDVTKPLDASTTVKVVAGDVVLNWAGFSDTNSGIKEYIVKRGLSTAAPATSCTTGTTIGVTGLDLTRTDLAPTAGTYVYRVCAVDNAGNTSAGVSKTVIVP